MESITKEVKKLLLAGLGAAVEGKEKGGKLLEELAEKGEIALEQGKVKNEELKHNIQKTFRGEKKPQDIMEAVKKLDARQLEELKAQIAGLEAEQAAAAEEAAEQAEEQAAAAEEAAEQAEEKADAAAEDGNA